MTLVFKTRRQRQLPGYTDVAQRVATPLSVADALTPKGVKAARALTGGAAGAIDHALPGDSVATIEARLLGTSVVDPVAHPPDPRLIAQLGVDLCLKHRVLPWRSSAGRVTVLATNTRAFHKMRDALRVVYGPVHLAIVTDASLDLAFARMCHRKLMQNAEERTALQESCRDWNAGKALRWGLILAFTLLACLITWPTVSFFVLCGWAVITLMLNTLLKIAAALLHLRPKHVTPAPKLHPTALPVISVLVPLFRERDIAGALVRRLSRLYYPLEKLDVCLVLEADDGTTQEALARAQLPPWMRAIKVPLGTLQTKPRALNYALNFAKGSIIGVYDAEDAPDPDQLQKVAARFAQAGPGLACLQGRLDFYNSYSNWLARCFTLEYATWFRIILPGLERLGLAVPLGGTTLFFRRGPFEDLGGWDAHNVTEDADLGIRLARHGYRTEIIDTVTQEEANARAWPWVKQRSRWLKGYAITYGVHMRNPMKLWKDLGPWRFFGVQLLFAGTISQFLLAPLLWSFWLMLFGLLHPLAGVLSAQAATTLAVVFFSSELIGIGVTVLAIRAAGKPGLAPWAPTLHFYFPLAAAAAYKGVIELATKPFYWEKTAHGIFAPSAEGTVTRPLRQPLHQVAAE